MEVLFFEKEVFILRGGKKRGSHEGTKAQRKKDLRVFATKGT